MGQLRAGGRSKQPVLVSSDEHGSSQPESAPTHPISHSHRPANQPAVPKEKTFQSASRGSASQSPLRIAPQRAPARNTSKQDRNIEKNKARSRTIHSFFNAATQRQQQQQQQQHQVQVSSSPEKRRSDPFQEDEEEDLISDASFEDELGKLADEHNQNSFALALRKRNRGLFEQSTTSTGVPPGSQKFRKASDGSKTARSFSASQPPEYSTDDSRPWTEKYSPANLDELAVHKRKVADVRTWLESVFARTTRKRLLVLKGAAGTGKTMTLLLLAREMGLEINEWKNPTRIDFTDQDYISVAAQFEDFLGRSGKFHTLEFLGDKMQPPSRGDKQTRPQVNHVIAMEEFPNTFTRSSTAVQRFRSIVLQYLASNSTSARLDFSGPADNDAPVIPLIMIISETSLSAESFTDRFTAHRLLGPEIVTHPGVTVIEFNAIAPTFLMKALELVVLKEARKTGRRQTPGPGVIKQLAEVGDLRSAVSTLEFLCLRGDEKENVWSGRIRFTKPKGASTLNVPLSTMEEESLAVITQRENTLGIFHSVGKVVYNKRHSPGIPPQPPSHIAHAHRARAPDTDPHRLFDEMGTDRSTFISALHENYVLSCSGTDGEETQGAINGCIDALSEADLLSLDQVSGRQTFQSSAVYNDRQEEISFQVAVRGLLFSLPYPVKRLQLSSAGRGDTFKMMFPLSLKLWRQRSENEEILEGLTSMSQKGRLKEGRRPGNSSGVESWKRSLGEAAIPTPSSASHTADSRGDAHEGLILHAGGSSARHEMLLERLPYIVLCQRKRDPSNPCLHQMEKLTNFTGVGMQNDEIPDHVDEGERSVPNLRLSKARPEKDSPGSMSGGIGDSDVINLVLSDDDIEDD